jgi:hypothetical protein
VIVPYTLCPVRVPIPGLGGALAVPRPLLPLRITGHGGSALRDGCLDSGADETLLDPTLAPSLGVDLTTAPQRALHLVGRGTIHCCYAAVTLRITDGVAETYEWNAVIAFAPFRVIRSLLGFAGFLQFFDHWHRTADLELTLVPNRNFPGRRI